jgi:hypothetical protein
MDAMWNRTIPLSVPIMSRVFPDIRLRGSRGFLFRYGQARKIIFVLALALVVPNSNPMLGFQTIVDFIFQWLKNVRSVLIATCSASIFLLAAYSG